MTNVRQPSPRTLVVTVSEAATMTPKIVDALRAAGVGDAGIEEQQPPFDEVYPPPVERRRAATGETGIDTSEPRGAPTDG